MLSFEKRLKKPQYFVVTQCATQNFNNSIQQNYIKIIIFNSKRVAQNCIKHILIIVFLYVRSIVCYCFFRIFLDTHFTKSQDNSRIMAGGHDVDDSHLKGLAKIFNGETTRGRANVAKATYAAVALIVLYFKLKPKS